MKIKTSLNSLELITGIELHSGLLYVYPTLFLFRYLTLANNLWIRNQNMSLLRYQDNNSHIDVSMLNTHP
jgi:hypothetical protein